MMSKVFLIGLIAVVGLSSFIHSNETTLSKYDSNKKKLFSNGINDGASGAPGDITCNACHVGALQDGSSQNTLTVSLNGSAVSDYIPGQSYIVRLTLSTGDVLEGFQATALDLVNDDMAGDFISINAGTNIYESWSSNNRDYANQTSTSNTEGNPYWEWQWDAPTTDVGPVRFYVASNIANGDLGPDNDMIFTSQHTLGSPLETDELTQDNLDFSAGYSAEQNKLHIKFNSHLVDLMYLNLVDLNGKSVLTRMLENSSKGSNAMEIQLPTNLESGIYVVHFFIGNKSTSSTIRILN